MSAEIFSINFIRSEFVPYRVRRVAVYFVLIYLITNLVFTVWLFASAFSSSVQWHWLRSKLQAQTQAVTPSGVAGPDVELMHERMVQELNRFNAVVHLTAQRFPVASKLAGIAETIPPRTWIQNLAASRDQRSLKIQALYLIDPKKPYDLPAKGWVQALKADPRFNQGLKRLELGTSSRTTQGDTKLFSFELLAEWK